MSAKYKFDLTGAEPIIRDMFAVPDTYQDGEVLAAGAAEAGGVASMGAGTGNFIGVSNQGETLPAQSGYSGPGITIGNDGATLTGTQAGGDIETLKVIVNPFAVYSVEYDQTSELTYDSVTDTTIVMGAGGASTGHPNFGGGWAWAGNTGKLDYVVSSAFAAGDTTLTTVTGTDTTSTSGILLYPAGSGIDYNVELTSNALSIAASLEEAVVGTDAVLGTNLANVIESTRREPTWLKPALQNQQEFFNIANSTNNNDNARAFAYISFFKGSEWNA